MNAGSDSSPARSSPAATSCPRSPRCRQCHPGTGRRDAGFAAGSRPSPRRPKVALLATEIRNTPTPSTSWIACLKATAGPEGTIIRPSSLRGCTWTNFPRGT